MSIIINHERLKRFFASVETKAFQQDLRPMGAIFVKDNEVIVLVDNEVSDQTFIDCLKALVNEHGKPNIHKAH